MTPPRFFSATVIGLFGVIVWMPIVYMILNSFCFQDAGDIRELFSVFVSRHLVLARNSFSLAVGATGLSLILGVPFAVLVCRTGVLGRKIFSVTYLIPLLIPPYIHAIVWTHLNGLTEKYLATNVFSLAGAIAVLSLAYFPFVALTTMSGLNSIDRNLEEASMLARGKWRTLTRISLPLVSPQICAGAVIVFILSLIEFSVPDMLRVRVYPLEIFIQFSALYDEKAATALSLPLMAITLMLAVLLRRYMKDRVYVQVSGGRSDSVRYSLGRWHLPACGFCCVVMFLSAALPVGILLKTAGPISVYAKAFSTSGVQIGYSFILAFGGSLLTLMLALSLTYLAERSSPRWGNLLSVAIFLPVAIPATTLGIGLIKVWNQPGMDIVYASSWIIIFGYVARFIPFSAVTVSSGLKQVNPSAEEAAFLTNRKWTRVVRRIVVPLTAPSLCAAFFIVFVLSFGELGTTILVIPPGSETIPIKSYNLMHYGADQEVAALCVILVFLILALAGIFLILKKRFAVAGV